MASEIQTEILIVEDEEKLARFIELELKHEGYTIDKAFDGRTALDKALEKDYDLILLDIKMPGMDGFETMEKLKAMDEDLADIPVAFLTADENAESEKRGVELGAVDFIKKPFIPEVLVMRVKSILSK